MSQKMIHQKSNGGNGQTGVEQQVATIVEQAIAKTKTEGKTGFPPEEIRALRRAALTMTAQFNKEQQKS